MRYENKVVLVTGGATGIGRATCRAFAREGAAVMIGDVDDRAGETAELIRKDGGRAMFCQADVRNGQEMTDLVARCVAEFGGMHAAFNNAGVLPPPEPFHEVSEDNLDLIMDVDLKGVFFAMQAEVRHFLANGGGAIVNTASVAGKVADPNMSAYVAAKHAVVGLTKAVAIEYAQKDIRVNSIGPGLVATPMTQQWLDSPEFREEFFKHNMIGRAAEPEEIAGTVLHLCSDEASFTNGAFFVMDGGQTSH